MTDEVTELQRQVVLEYNPVTLAYKIQELVLDGWLIDEDRPLNQIGFYWECGFIRDSTAAQRQADAEQAEKPTRAEILAKARAAKAAKKLEEQGNV